MIRKFFVLALLLLSSKIIAAQPGENSHDCSWIRDYLTPVSDFPKPGITFQWYANLLKDPEAFHRTIQAFSDRYRDSHLDAIVGLDSRGFIFGAALAYELKVPFVMV